MWSIMLAQAVLAVVVSNGGIVARTEGFILPALWVVVVVVWRRFGPGYRRTGRLRRSTPGTDRRERPATVVEPIRPLGDILNRIGWYTIFFAPIVINVASSSLPLSGFVGNTVRDTAVVAVCMLGAQLRRRGRRHMARVLGSLTDLPADARAVIFLRGFSDDYGLTQAEPTTGVFGTIGWTQEEQLARALRPLGTMVALGQPGDALPPSGAQRHYASDRTWRAEVLAALHMAELVVLAAGPGGSLTWEVQQVVATMSARRVILLITKDARQYESFKTANEDLFPRGLPPFGPETRAAHLVNPSYVRALIWFDADWTPHLAELFDHYPFPRPRRYVELAVRKVLKQLYQGPQPRSNVTRLIAGLSGR
ncbi:hypothetical protein IU500_01160 [Nocardia terpenica]|uniref:hypothetical protein n=1 Tax=Nocardia terpenica TaxID=455432 RepID=UPI0018947983|nr:hypothetical protein [Nocardia terpenica]MBF6059815.1 hypothetical protein [Nocardia terpenica]MBF6102644.1 hypothetical protein [Nocardia terpenica]MBF6111165.1 hypothetical protein [Nocardia terpenica]MBF6117296.1 hypothetical protein [Nocardia terpenica]MBF6150863.1 hypothetical protein [Nocardia terpenica]